MCVASPPAQTAPKPERHTAGSFRRLTAAAVVLAAFAAACAGTDTATDPPPATETQAPATTAPSAASDAPATSAPAAHTATSAADTTTATTESATDTTPQTTEASDSDQTADTATDRQQEDDSADSSVAGERIDDEDDADAVAEDTDEAGPETSTPQADETADSEPEADDTDEAAQEPDEPIDTAEPTYENRSASSVFPPRAYFDHDAIRALFPECPPTPALPQWMVDHFAHWDWMYSNWDTETHTTYNDKVVASGWWTDERLAVWRPDQGITAASARRNASYIQSIDSLTLWGEGAVNTSEMYHSPYIHDSGEFTFPALYERLATVGFVSASEQVSTTIQDLTLIRDTSLAGTNPEGINMFRLLWNWAQFRTQQAPIDKEPTAWAMRTLLEARDAGCVAEHMAAVCDGTRDAESPILGRTNRLGQALRSIVCAN